MVAVPTGVSSALNRFLLSADIPHAYESTPLLATGPVPFGPYLLDGLIAQGGMARVYRARLRGALGFEKPLVVKQVRPELASDPRFVELFAREAKALVRLVHPHIVPIYELGVVEGTYFIAMEHIAGATLEDVLRSQPMEAPLVAHVAIQVAEALDHAHGRHALVHRDVTPRNIMVDEAGHARLLDFGIAAPAEGSSEIFGTPGYLSPEQARGEEVGPASDVFSLGCVLLRGLMGQVIFAGDTGRRKLIGGSGHEESWLGPWPAEVPLELREQVAAMLAPRAEERPSAREVSRALRKWLAGVEPMGVAGAMAERARAVTSTPPLMGDALGPATAAIDKVTPLATSRLIAEAREETGTSGETIEEATQPIAGRRSAPKLAADRSSRSAVESAAPVEVAPPALPPPASVRRFARHLGVIGVFGAATALAMVAASVIVFDPFGTSDMAAGEASTVGRGPAFTVGARGAGGEREAPLVREARDAHSREALSANDRVFDGNATAHESSISHRPVPHPPVHLSKSPQREPDEPGIAPDLRQEPTPASTIPTPRAATVTVTAAPWARVSVDGQELGTTPLRSIAIPAGRHRVRLWCPPLGAAVTRDVALAADARLEIYADMERDAPEMSVRSWE